MSERRFFCKQDGCSAVFTKGEHLARHERGHLGLKPFICDICTRRFGRQDSLLRHIRTHRTQTTENARFGEQDQRFGTATSLLSSSLAGTDPSTGFGLAQESMQLCQTHPISSPDRVHNSTRASNATAAADTAASNDAGRNALNYRDDFDWNFNDDDLFKILLATPTAASTSGFSRPQSSLGVLQGSAQANPDSDWLQGSAEAGRKAVQAMNRVIQSLPESLVVLESENAASIFFEDCLDLFFRHHLDVVPIIHRPTFNPRECNTTSLLHILSLGSCFLPGPTYEADSLYLISHAVMANAWEQLLTCRGPHDGNDGVQLVLSCSLGATYALVCRNSRIRKMSHSARGLGSVWARDCGLFSIDSYRGIVVPSLTAPNAEKLAAWQKWAAGETQLRGLLWQYVIDGLSSQFYHHPTLLRHEANPLSLPTSSAAFNAASPDAWIKEMSDCNRHSQLTVREYVRALFRGDVDTIRRPISKLGIRVVLECLQSLILREADGGEDTIGAISKSEIFAALLNLKYHHFDGSDSGVELLLRWHSVCLSMSADVRRLCEEVGPSQLIAELFHLPPKELEKGRNLFDLRAWVHATDARRAILHALEIRELAQRLSFGEAYSIHTPFTMFSAATVVAAFLAAESRSLHVPVQIDWAVLYEDLSKPVHSSTTLDIRSIETINFLAGTSARACGITTLRKLSSEMNMFHSQVQAMAGTWGITRAAQEVIEQWAQIFRGCGR
ncbi:hypothetical protein PV08_06412 [Exophiala spinifera]|uniref:C2H2-type domain-containing protein n=1 Tax=Exophiala spinifera TaxID=91928 RepID=A0A0D1YMT7_9EURO|nr:uncharacterized protein PV08_06412 [Exophiala spinifera]KIW16361.1 hypothetical protein PV08_06412 [Exophiala spinifera]